MLTITVLLENETSFENLTCEHGLSMLLACEGKSLLLDTGKSDAFLRNASIMGVDLDAVSAIVISHGHHDHAGGLGHILRRFAQTPNQRPEVIAHPDILRFRRRTAAAKEEPGKYLGVPEDALALLQSWPLRLTREPVQLTESLLYLGEIPRKYPETQALLGEIACREGDDDADKKYKPDRLLDDTALVYVNGEGENRALTIISGCAHSGIINVIEHAKTVTGVGRIHAVIGGLHLKGVSDAVKEQTLRYFTAQNVEVLRGCHCTENALDGDARQKPLHTGDIIEIA